jgi:hypothetical protein
MFVGLVLGLVYFKKFCKIKIVAIFLYLVNIV